MAELSLILAGEIGLGLGLGFAGYLVTKYIPTYLNKKAENLATKEDLKELTLIPERIKAEFSQKTIVHKVQFEAEFKAHQDLWQLAQTAIVAFVRWIPVIYGAPVAEMEAAFGEAQLKFANALEHYDPFVPAETWQAFKELDEFFVNRKVDWAVQQRQLSLVDIEAQRHFLMEIGERCKAAIKARLAAVSVLP